VEEQIVQKYVELIKETTESFNEQANALFTISFAVGYAWTYNVKDITMEMLCSIADKNMYIDKLNSKKHVV